MKKASRKAGWKVSIKRDEPRASILDELWQSSATPQLSLHVLKTHSRNNETKSRGPASREGECVEFLPDSPEFLAYTIDDIGYRDRIDSAFLKAIARARGGG